MMTEVTSEKAVCGGAASNDFQLWLRNRPYLYDDADAWNIVHVANCAC